MFSLPLLYTMEVWWAGFTAGPLRLLVYGGVTFVLLLGYNHYAGMHHDATFLEVVIDSVEEMGIGLLLAAGLLLLMGQIRSGMDYTEVLGKIFVEAMTVAIGVSVGSGQLGADNDKAGRKRESLQDDLRFGRQLVIGGCGATLFAANIAPTEEVVMIATEISDAQLLGFMLLSLVLAALILYYIEFAGSRRFVRRGDLAAVVVGTVSSYAVALVVAAAVLWFFGRFDQVAPQTMLAQTIVLGLAATLGASAGRLLVQ